MVFPAPFGPSSATDSPGRSSRSTPSRAAKSRYRRRRPRATKRGGPRVVTAPRARSSSAIVDHPPAPRLRLGPAPAAPFLARRRAAPLAWPHMSSRPRYPAGTGRPGRGGAAWAAPRPARHHRGRDPGGRGGYPRPDPQPGRRRGGLRGRRARSRRRCLPVGVGLGRRSRPRWSSPAARGSRCTCRSTQRVTAAMFHPVNDTAGVALQATGSPRDPPGRPRRPRGPQTAGLDVGRAGHDGLLAGRRGDRQRQRLRDLGRIEGYEVVIAPSVAASGLVLRLTHLDEPVNAERPSVGTPVRAGTTPSARSATSRPSPARRSRSSRATAATTSTWSSCAPRRTSSPRPGAGRRPQAWTIRGERDDRPCRLPSRDDPARSSVRWIAVNRRSGGRRAGAPHRRRGGRVSLKALLARLPGLREAHRPDVVVVNAENAAAGAGRRRAQAHDRSRPAST